MSTRIVKSASVMRKQPKQARSRSTVDAIIEAGARILSAEGWAGFNTNRVADEAGASVGSLYQYFPDKLSLIDAIRQRHLGDSLAAVRNCLRPRQTAGAFVAELVDAVIAAHSIHPGLHRVLLDEAPNSEGFRDSESAFEREYLGCFTEAVRRFGSRGSDVLDAMAGRVMSDVIDGVIHNAARRGVLNDAAMKAELIRLLGASLRPR